MTIDTTDVRALEVLADQLQEQGDPRGEFMALQCRQATGALSSLGRRRIAELRRHHRKNFLGDLDGVLTRPRFKRGLLHAAALDLRPKQIEATWTSEHWSSLEILELPMGSARWSAGAAGFFNTRPALHTLINLGHAPEAQCPRVTTVCTSRNLFELADLLDAFPNLRRVALRARFDDAKEFWAHPRMRRLELILLSSEWFVGSLYIPDQGEGPAVRLCWTKDALHLDRIGVVGNSYLEIVRRGPRLKSFEVPFRDQEDLESYLAHDNLRLAELIATARKQGAELVFASSARGYRLYGGEYLPARFLRAVR